MIAAICIGGYLITLKFMRLPAPMSSIIRTLCSPIETRRVIFSPDIVVPIISLSKNQKILASGASEIA